MPFKPGFEIEQQYWEQGIETIVGVDEAGMGALAGPVVAAAVIWNRQFLINNYPLPIIIRDSKTMSPKQRSLSSEWIKKMAVAWAVGEASVEEITQSNIRGASHLAMRRAIDNIKIRPDLILIDGNPAQPHSTIPAINFISGDQLSCSIAAASILAKVSRDQVMVGLSLKYSSYGFETHKGYGSKSHIRALHKYGASPVHRPTYAPVAQAIQDKKATLSNNIV